MLNDLMCRGNVIMKRLLFIPLLLILVAATALAQSPNTASMIVLVADQAGAVVKDAKVSVVNTATGDSREAVTGADGAATFSGLSLTGTYKVTVAREGFGNEERSGLTLRSGETATIKVTLLAGSQTAEVTVYGTTEGVRADPLIGIPLRSEHINETPILGRKTTSLPLLNSAFRQGKGTGDLFVNQIYFITGAGSRRATTVTLDGANNDEGWGRQTAVATIPIGAIQEIAILSNAFSAEYGWTAGQALNIVTKSGTNDLHGEGLFMFRPGDWQAKTFSTRDFCPRNVPTCVTPSTLRAINPRDMPDALQQYSATYGLHGEGLFMFRPGDWQAKTFSTRDFCPRNVPT